MTIDPDSGMLWNKLFDKTKFIIICPNSNFENDRARFKFTFSSLFFLPEFGGNGPAIFKSAHL